MPKVGALILSYGSTDFLRPVIKQYLRLDRVLVMNYLFPESEPFPDDTPQICKELGVEISKGIAQQHKILNLGLDLIDCDMVFISDSDEIILRAEQDELIKRQTRQPNESIRVSMYEYAGDLYHIYEPRSHMPVVMAKQSERFCEVRNVCSGGCGMSDIYMHHLGFLAGKEKTEWKRKKQIITNKFDVVTELMSRPIKEFTPPEELVECLR